MGNSLNQNQELKEFLPKEIIDEKLVTSILGYLQDLKIISSPNHRRFPPGSNHH
jgi:hypothetical protein